jgi:cytochrome P450
MDEEATEGHTVLNIEDLTDEAYTILSAAADSSANVMTRTTYFVLSSPRILSTLMAELVTAFPGPNQRLPFLKLEKLPYLTAVIKEGLRLSFHPPGRLPRVIETDAGIELNGYHVPKGTIVGMSSWMMHRDPTVWPEPDKYSPERWLDPAEAKRLDKYLVNFSKGARQCIGMQYVLFVLFSVSFPPGSKFLC